MRRPLALLLICLCASWLWGQGAEDPSWLKLETGKRLFTQKNFAQALLTLNTAVLERNERFLRARDTLDSVLADTQARRAKDSISRLLGIYAESDLRSGDIQKIKSQSGGFLSRELAAYEGFRISDPFQNLIDVLQAALGLRSPERLGDSLEALRVFIDHSRFFPEAECWIAKIYMAEGEYEIAQRQLEKAISQEASLEVPDFIHEIRYLLASLHKTKKDLAAMEREYKAILSKDELYTSARESFRKDAMRRTLVEDGIDKFLILYRHKADFAARAYLVLGEYYYKSGRYGQAILHLMVAADILGTKVINDLNMDDPDYRFSNLSELLARMEEKPELARFARDSEVYKTFYYLASALHGDGRSRQAKEVWLALSRSPDAWGRRAAQQAQSPQLESAEAFPEF